MPKNFFQYLSRDPFREMTSLCFFLLERKPLSGVQARCPCIQTCVQPPGRCAPLKAHEWHMPQKKSAYGTDHQTRNHKAYSNHQAHTGCTKGRFRVSLFTDAHSRRGWQCCPHYPILSGSGKVSTHTQEIAWRIACHGSHRKFDCLTRPCTEARYWWFIWSTSDVVTYGRHRSQQLYCT